MDILGQLSHCRVARGVNVIQFNLEDGLALFGDASFDVVLQIDTLQHLRNAEVMLRETARVGRIGVVAFPNFAHWPNRLSVLRGRMPVTRRLPYQWYDTPNIRVGTYKDFEALARKNGLKVLDAFGHHLDAQFVRQCDGGAHDALIGGLPFDAEVALPAFARIEPLRHRAHESEVPDVQLALPGGADLDVAARGCAE